MDRDSLPLALILEVKGAAVLLAVEKSDKGFCVREFLLGVLGAGSSHEFHVLQAPWSHSIFESVVALFAEAPKKDQVVALWLNHHINYTLFAVISVKWPHDFYTKKI